MTEQAFRCKLIDAREAPGNLPSPNFHVNQHGLHQEVVHTKALLLEEAGAQPSGCGRFAEELADMPELLITLFQQLRNR